MREIVRKNLDNCAVVCYAFFTERVTFASVDDTGNALSRCYWIAHIHAHLDRDLDLFRLPHLLVVFLVELVRSIFGAERSNAYG